MDIASPRQLLAVIPHLLGFFPADCLVVAAMDSAEIELLVRYALDDDLDTTALSNVLGRAASPAYVAVGYGSHCGPLVAAVSGQLAAFPLLDSLLVQNGTWRSVLCDDLMCCPEQGRALDDVVDPLTAALIAAGSAPYRSREDLVAAFVPLALDDRQHEKRAAALAEIHPDRPVDMLPAVLKVLHSVGAPPWVDVATVCVGLQDVRVRDAVLRHLHESPQSRWAVRSALLALLSKVPADAYPAVACVLAGCAWLDGNGAVARIAIDRCREADPGYSLARLLDRALQHGIPPTVWADSLAAVSIDECLSGAA
jgi:hypothetical protein